MFFRNFGILENSLWIEEYLKYNDTFRWYNVAELD